MKYSKIYNIDEIKTISHSIFSNIDCIKNVYLFGSYARRKATEHSDLDFLVELSCYDVPSKREVYGTIVDLEECYHKQIDLVIDINVESYALPLIEKDKVLIYEQPL